jgi:hypothetical protein
MLSNFDLEKLAKVYKVKLHGVYSKDRLPERMNKGWYIINLQNLGEGQGSHWVCYFHEPIIKEESVYFDSYGVVPPLVINNQLNLGDVINHQQIQPLTNDENCGLYCIGIMCFFNQNQNSTNSSNLKAFQSLFSKTDLSSNQYRLKSYLSNYSLKMKINRANNSSTK